jgi:hypothetical protein
MANAKFKWEYTSKNGISQTLFAKNAKIIEKMSIKSVH